MSYRYKCIALLLILAISVASSVFSNDRTEDSKKVSQAKNLVQQSLQAEASGDYSNRTELLKEATELKTEEPSAYWHMGQVKDGKAWVSYSSFVEKSKKSKALEEYRNLRDESKPTVESQLALIKFCRKHGLKDQAIAHWSAIAELDPDNAEAKSQLGLQQINGSWIETRELEATQEKAKRVSEFLQRMKPDLIQMAVELQSSVRDKNEVVQELTKDFDVDAIPAYELFLSSAHKPGAAVVVEVLKQSSEVEATLSLARHATWVTDVEVRDAAIEALKSREQLAFVPAMLSELQGPWLANRQWSMDQSNRLVVRYSLIADGPEHRALRVLDQTYFLSGNVSNAFSDAAVRNNLSQTQLETTRKAINDRIEARNTQIIEALRSTTGEWELQTPQKWWEWWDDRNEVYSTDEKPIITSYASSSVSLQGASRQPENGMEQMSSQSRRTVRERKDCLAGGTPILTQRGPIGIERVRIGDMVLSKHSETGEVRFQPVMRTTVRAPENLIRITLAENSQGHQQVIRASGGHPFWVSGKGWVRARELEVGSRLHGLEDAMEVNDVAVEEKATKTYNLVVRDFHSYFVGSDGILSHDNSIVAPTSCLVPGLVAK
jgi:tetratricopeptide (TPR) repeat protein